MDIGGEGVSPAAVVDNDGNNGSNLNISDVFEVIAHEYPTFGAGAALEDMSRPPAAQPGPYTRITEQPAGKALRFRYECEGRSAGSIPGVSSTPENRTFPTIMICGYKGRVVVVVSCVTKDEPFKPHPHNLVGRDCQRGVCTVRETITDENNRVAFKNLGIQCVKRRDIAEALRVREELRVDPFKTRYHHKNQPQSIDLNAVRLCFQVFMTDDAGKVKQSLHPVVSDIIYDKKAMSDLQIAQISHCSGPMSGGTRVILLCEKVNREDTAVVFFQEENGQVVWEERAHIEAVHKQVAIVFNTPAYTYCQTQEHVNVQLQLQRVTDKACSTPVKFEYIPARFCPPGARKPLPDLAALAAILADSRHPAHTDATPQLTDTDMDITDIDSTPAPSDDNNNKSVELDNVTSTSDSNDEVTVTADINGNIEDVDMPDSNAKSLDDLLDQVAELDEIYSENRTRLENVTNMNNDETDLEDFNDAGTYTSLQLAFKNPISISEPEPYEDVQVQTYRGPIIEFSPLKRDVDDERAPPLPPKRVRKVDNFKTSQTSVDSILKPGRQLPVTRNTEILKRDRTELSVARSEPALPPVKKRSFFSRLFRRKEKSPAPSVKSEGKEKKSKPVGRSVSSISGQRPSKFKSSVSHTSLKDNASGTGLSYADSITHISLHGDENELKSTSQTSLRRPASLAPLPPTDGGTILVAESVLALDASAFKKLQDDLDLTDAEHYALYMAVAPHATVSEFDETSCYYSPVDGSKFQN